MLDAVPPSKDQVLVYVPHLAGEERIELSTGRLTADCSTAELHPKMPCSRIIPARRAATFALRFGNMVRWRERK